MTNGTPRVSYFDNGKVESRKGKRLSAGTRAHTKTKRQSMAPSSGTTPSLPDGDETKSKASSSPSGKSSSKHAVQGSGVGKKRRPETDSEEEEDEKEEEEEEEEEEEGDEIVNQEELDKTSGRGSKQSHEPIQMNGPKKRLTSKASASQCSTDVPGSHDRMSSSTSGSPGKLERPVVKTGVDRLKLIDFFMSQIKDCKTKYSGKNNPGKHLGDLIRKCRNVGKELPEAEQDDVDPSTFPDLFRNAYAELDTLLGKCENLKKKDIEIFERDLNDLFGRLKTTATQCMEYAASVQHRVLMGAAQVKSSKAKERGHINDLVAKLDSAGFGKNSPRS